MFEDKEIVVFDLDGMLVDIALDWDVIRDRLCGAFPGIGAIPPGATTTVITERIAKTLGHERKRRAYGMIREFEAGCSMTSIEKNIGIARNLKKEGKKLAILSNNCHETIEECLEKSGIRGMFDFIVGKDDVEKHKPDPEGLHVIMRHFGASSDEVAFVGNENVDADAGKAAGIETVLI